MSRQRSFRITHQVGYKHQLRWGKQTPATMGKTNTSYDGENKNIATK